MKKLLALLLIVNSIFIAGNGQERSIEYGFQAGANITSAYGASVSKAYKSTLTGLSIGANAKIKFDKNWGLKASLFYEQNGWAYRSLSFENNTSTGLSKGDVLFKSNYLKLPVLADYSFGKKIKYYFDGGIFIGFLLSNQTITRIEQSNGTTETKGPSDLNKINFGIAVGGGVKIPLTPGIKLDIGLRNLTGLTNRSAGSEIKLNSFSILAGLCFDAK